MVDRKKGGRALKTRSALLTQTRASLLFFTALPIKALMAHSKAPVELAMELLFIFKLLTISKTDRALFYKASLAS